MTRTAVDVDGPHTVPTSGIMPTALRTSFVTEYVFIGQADVSRTPTPRKRVFSTYIVTGTKVPGMYVPGTGNWYISTYTVVLDALANGGVSSTAFRHSPPSLEI